MKELPNPTFPCHRQPTRCQGGHFTGLTILAFKQSYRAGAAVFRFRGRNTWTKSGKPSV